MSTTSRYKSCTVETATLPDGRIVKCLETRVLPIPSTMPQFSTVEVKPTERLDNVSTRVFRDPLQYHRLCDANGAMNPFTLVDDVGPVLVVPEAAPE